MHSRTRVYTTAFVLKHFVCAVNHDFIGNRFYLFNKLLIMHILNEHVKSVSQFETFVYESSYSLISIHIQLSFYRSVFKYVNNLHQKYQTLNEAHMHLMYVVLLHIIAYIYYIHS